MSDWLTLTIRNSGLSQRVRKSAIIAYGVENGIVYVIRNGQMLQVTQSEAQLQAALDDHDRAQP
jgi:oligoribonuclease (3'-5' exoribonuclease)